MPENDTPAVETNFHRGTLAVNQGDLPLAAASFEAVIRQLPHHVDALANLGDVYKKMGRDLDAIEVYRRLLSLQPQDGAALLALALLLEANGQSGEAIMAYRRLLESNDDQPAIHFLLGNALFHARQWEPAVVHYRRVIEAFPESAEAHFNLGLAWQKQQRFAEAEQAYGRALALAPGNSETAFSLGVVLQTQGRLDEAIGFYERAVALTPDFTTAHYNMGIAHNDGGHYEEAIACFRKAVALEPANVKVLNNLGLAFHNRQEYGQAIVVLSQAIALQPDFADAYSNLGNAYLELDQLAEAYKAYQHSLLLNPGFDRAYYNMGCYWQKQNQIDTAISMYRRAIDLNHDLVEAHWNLSHCLLVAGDFASGFQEYAWRWRRKGTVRVPLAKPEWRGEPCPDATILVHTEQGSGDTFQFVRILPLLRQRAGRVVLACEEPLRELLQTLPGRHETVALQAAVAGKPPFDFQVPLLNLPALLEVTLDNLPSTVPYLFPDYERRGRFLPLVARAGEGMKIGIVWRGNPIHKNDKKRSCRWQDMESLLGLPPGSTFFSLQKQEAPPAGTAGVVDLGPYLDSFADTAALISLLDLVISVDTSVAHLAGAMGKPVWVVIPYEPDWRWMLYREDSPWYPTMRLFRQERPGDWAELFVRVREALAQAGRESGEAPGHSAL